jgi:hypothetical protein
LRFKIERAKGSDMLLTVPAGFPGKRRLFSALHFNASGLDGFAYYFRIPGRLRIGSALDLIMQEERIVLLTIVDSQ